MIWEPLILPWSEGLPYIRIQGEIQGEIRDEVQAVRSSRASDPRHRLRQHHAAVEVGTAGSPQQTLHRPERAPPVWCPQRPDPQACSARLEDLTARDPTPR